MLASNYVPGGNSHIRIVRRQCSKCRRWSKKMSNWRSRSSEAAAFVGASGFRFSVMSHSQPYQSGLQHSIAVRPSDTKDLISCIIDSAA